MEAGAPAAGAVLASGCWLPAVLSQEKVTLLRMGARHRGHASMDSWLQHDVHMHRCWQGIVNVVARLSMHTTHSPSSSSSAESLAASSLACAATATAATGTATGTGAGTTLARRREPRRPA